MKSVLTATFLGLFTLSACTTGTINEFTRVSRMMPVLPKAADREGIYTMLEVRGSLLVQYFPGQVSERTILSRLTNFCARKGGIPQKNGRPTIRSEATMADGTTAPTRSFIVVCN